jgi:hypothetical protein
MHFSPTAPGLLDSCPHASQAARITPSFNGGCTGRPYHSSRRLVAMFHADRHPKRYRAKMKSGVLLPFSAL